MDSERRSNDKRGAGEDRDPRDDRFSSDGNGPDAGAAPSGSCWRDGSNECSAVSFVGGRAGRGAGRKMRLMTRRTEGTKIATTATVATPITLSRFMVLMRCDAVRCDAMGPDQTRELRKSSLIVEICGNGVFVKHSRS